MHWTRSRGPSVRVGMLLVVLFWAGNFTAVKLAFTQLDPLSFTAIRFTIGAIVLWGVVRWVEGPSPLPPGAFWPLVWLGLIGNAIYQLFFMAGLQRTSATKTSLILAGMPALVTLAAGLLGIERVTTIQRFAVLIATVGVTVVVLGRGGSIDGGFGAGEMFLLAAVVTWAIYTLLLRRWTLQMSTLNLTAWTMYTSAPVLLVIGMPSLLRTDWHKVSFVGWGGVLYSALLSLVAAYVLWNRGVAVLGVARTVMYNTLVPLVATLIAMIGLHERPGMIHVVGGALILVGVLLTGHSGAPEG